MAIFSKERKSIIIIRPSCSRFCLPLNILLRSFNSFSRTPRLKFKLKLLSHSAKARCDDLCLFDTFVYLRLGV